MTHHVEQSARGRLRLRPVRSLQRARQSGRRCRSRQSFVNPVRAANSMLVAEYLGGQVLEEPQAIANGGQNGCERGARVPEHLVDERFQSVA